jgi:hypothetical protein
VDRHPSRVGPLTVWVGHSCPTPLPLPLILILILICHPEEAELHAKRATPNEEPALSLPKGPMQFVSISAGCPSNLRVVIPNRAPSPVRNLLVQFHKPRPTLRRFNHTRRLNNPCGTDTPVRRL